MFIVDIPLMSYNLSNLSKANVTTSCFKKFHNTSNYTDQQKHQQHEELYTSKLVTIS